MLFKSKSAPSQSPAVPAPAIHANPATDIAARRVDPVQHSVIPYGMQVTGDLISRGDISVKGNIQGNITCRTLTLEGEPVIGGSVQAETIRICGTFNGDVRAKKVALTKSAKMVGEIRYQSLEMEAGASFEGALHHLDDAQEISRSGG